MSFDAFGRDANFVERVGPTLDFLCDRVFRFSLSDTQHIPETGPFIVVANHAGALPWDAVVLSHALAREGHEVRALVEDSAITVPFLGTFLKRVGAVRASRVHAHRLLEGGESILVFPEGHQGSGKGFTRRYEFRRFGRGGFVRVAAKHKVPIVPIAIIGPEDTSPLLYKLPVTFGRTQVPFIPLTPGLLPARWAARVLEPREVPTRVQDDGARAIEIANEIKSDLEEAYKELLDARPSVFF